MSGHIFSERQLSCHVIPMQIGTATGAMLVFDLRNDPVNPWFQVGC
jgi:hypothetical protein